MTRPSEPTSRAWASTRARISRDRRLDEVGGGPGRPSAGDPDDEVAQDVPPVRGMGDLGVELDPVQAAVRIDEPGERGGVGLGGRMEALGKPGDRVAVAHPDGLVPVEPGGQAVLDGEGDRRRTVLALGRGEHVAAQLVGHEMGAVADPEDRDPAVPDRPIGTWGVDVVDGARPAREDDRLGVAPLDLGPRRVVGEQLRVDVELPDPPRDELGELAPEVEDDDGVGLGGRPAADRQAGAGAIVRGAIRAGGMECRLEVRLDLGVVGGENPVTRVGRLAVDGLATARPGR